MSASLQHKIEVRGSPDPAVLALLDQAFERFNDASSKLQERYEELARETDSLRERLRLKELEVKRAERLSTLGEMSAAIAHEVRNPLGAMKLFLSLLRDECAGNSGALSIVQQIETGATAIDNVVANILQFSRQKALPLEPVDLVAVLDDLRKYVGQICNQPEVLKVEITRPCRLIANESALRQAFNNLILNALQATRFLGPVEIRVSREEQDICITVCDNGPGITAELLTTIFEPFVTSKNEGTGLGLAIVRQIIEHHGGTISARNNGGAVFNIRLPANGKSI